jgi:hypothetical protein
MDAAQCYARLREYCLGLLEAWAGYGLEERFSFAEKRRIPLRRVEAALILISNLPERAGQGDYPPLAASVESGELEFLKRDVDPLGHSLGQYARRMAGPGA